MRGPGPRPGLKIIKFPAAAGNFISRGRARRTSDDVGSAPKPSQYAVGEGFHARPAWDEGLRGCARIKWCADCASTLHAAT